jgi:hypothetical protein
MAVDQQIFDAVCSALGAVGTVHKWRPSNLAQSELPALVVRDPSCPVNAAAEIGRFSHSLSIEIEGMVKASGSPAPAKAAEAARALVASIVAAMGSDPTWGGLAVRTTYSGRDLEVGQAEVSVSECTVNFIIEYRTAAFAT